MNQNYTSFCHTGKKIHILGVLQILGTSLRCHEMRKVENRCSGAQAWHPLSKVFSWHQNNQTVRRIIRFGNIQKDPGTSPTVPRWLWTAPTTLLWEGQGVALTAANAGRDVEGRGAGAWGSNRSSPSYLGMRMRNGTAALEDSLVISYTTKRTLTMRSSSHALWYFPKGVENSRPHRNCPPMFRAAFRRCNVCYV